MKLALFLLTLGVQAQNGVFFVPPTIYPGSRVSILFVTSALGTLQTPAPPPVVTVTVQGREYRLPWIPERFPPADELSPNPNAGAVYLAPKDLPIGPAVVRFGEVKVTTEIGGPPPNEIYRLAATSIAYAQQQSDGGPIRRNRLTDPARPGDQITLWGTGFDRATVTVDGSQIEKVTLVNQSDGLDRIEFRLPVLPTYSCETSIKINQKQVTISTVDWGRSDCSHRLGFPSATLAHLDRGGKIPMAAFFFSGLPSVQYGDVSLAGIPVDARAEPPSWGCAVQQIRRGSTTGNLIPASRLRLSEAVLTTPLGTVLRGTVSSGNTHDFRYNPFEIRDLSIPWLEGKWTFELRPDPAVTIDARAPIRWTSATRLSEFSPDKDLVLEWIPSTTTDRQEFVQFSRAQYASQPIGDVVGWRIDCSQPLSAGRLVVPSSLLSSIPGLRDSGRVSQFAAAYLKSESSRQPDGRFIRVQYTQTYP